jgi:hypothetical protein
VTHDKVYGFVEPAEPLVERGKLWVGPIERLVNPLY